jgi:hypothetical protein
MNTDSLPPFIGKLLAYLRMLRFTFMLSKVFTKTKMKVIDIGCGIDGRSFVNYVPADWEIVGIDIIPKERVKHLHPDFTYIMMDAQDLRIFGSNEFDLAVSIGMLEHITDEVVFKRIVSEIRRIAKQYIVIVPYKYCWIEPHYGIPFFPLLSNSLQLALVKILNLCNHRDIAIKDSSYIKNNYQWRPNPEYRMAFPDSTIHLLPTLEGIAITRKSKLTY